MKLALTLAAVLALGAGGAGPALARGPVVLPPSPGLVPIDPMHPSPRFIVRVTLPAVTLVPRQARHSCPDRCWRGQR